MLQLPFFLLLFLLVSLLLLNDYWLIFFFFKSCSRSCMRVKWIGLFLDRVIFCLNNRSSLCLFNNYSLWLFLLILEGWSWRSLNMLRIFLSILWSGNLLLNRVVLLFASQHLGNIRSCLFGFLNLCISLLSSLNLLFFGLDYRLCCVLLFCRLSIRSLLRK
jgi:hypothetical protein